MEAIEKRLGEVEIEIEDEFEDENEDLTEDKIKELREKRLKYEIELKEKLRERLKERKINFERRECIREGQITNQNELARAFVPDDMKCCLGLVPKRNEDGREVCMELEDDDEDDDEEEDNSGSGNSGRN